MNEEDSTEPIIADWPFDWPGRRVVELDNLGDPGCWLDIRIPIPEDLLFGGLDDRQSAADLADAYIEAAQDDYFPLPSDFGMSEEETREMVIDDFAGFIQEWRTRTIASRGQSSSESGDG